MASTRYILEQFDSGITLDGTRIERALDGLLDQLNSVDPNLVMRRWVPTHLVTGLVPDVNAAPITPLPWMGAYNPDHSATAEPVTHGWLNPYRVKSAWIDGIDPAVDPFTKGELYQYEVSLVITKPTILSNWTITLATDRVYTNNFKYGATAPPGYTVGMYVHDFTVEVLIDSILDPMDRKKTAVEAVNYRFAMDRFKLSAEAVNAAAFDNLLPLHTEGAVDGMVVELPIACLLPENSRVRLIMVVPAYLVAPATTSGWGEFPWQKQVWSSDLVLLEATE